MSSARALRSADVVPAKITSAPKCRTPSTFTRAAVSGMTIDRRDAERAGDQRDRLAVIARRVGDHARGPRLRRQLRQHVARAANLERAARLQVLALERERGGSEDGV